MSFSSCAGYKPKLLGDESDVPLTPRSKAQADADEADASSGALQSHRDESGIDLSTSEHGPALQSFRATFDLDRFLAEHKLQRLAKGLRDEGFEDPEALALAQRGDLELLGLRRGEVRVLERAIVLLRERMREAGIPLEEEGTVEAAKAKAEGEQVRSRSRSRGRGVGALHARAGT